MKVLRFVFLIVLFQQALNRIYSDSIPIVRFRKGDRWVFINKITLQKGETKVNLQIVVRGAQDINATSLELNIIPESEWQQQLNNKCNRNNSRRLIHPLTSGGSPSYSFQLLQIERQQTYYFVLRDCESKLNKEYSNYRMFLDIKLTIIHNGNHLGLQEDHWLIFPLMFLIGLSLSFLLKKSHSKQQEYNYPKIIVLISMICNLIALFWKALSFAIYYFSGSEIFILDFFYLGMHALSETLIICLIILIGYGWMINYGYDQNFDLTLPLMAMLGFMNTILNLLNKLNDEDHDKYHMYDSIPGKIMIGFRVFTGIALLIGALLTYSKTNTKKKGFVIEVAVLGMIYIMSMPILIMITQTWIQNWHRQQFLFISTEIFQIVSSMVLTYMMNSSKSSYSLYNIKNSSFLYNEKIF